MEDNSSASDSESDSLEIDPLALIKIEATKVGDWQLAEKINAFPVEYRQGRNGGESVIKTWKPNSNKELVQLQNIAKEHGRGSFIFRNCLESMFSAHVLFCFHIEAARDSGEGSILSIARQALSTLLAAGGHSLGLGYPLESA